MFLVSSPSYFCWVSEAENFELDFVPKLLLTRRSRIGFLQDPLCYISKLSKLSSHRICPGRVTAFHCWICASSL
jgi:hypothetical protein